MTTRFTLCYSRPANPFATDNRPLKPQIHDHFPFNCWPVPALISFTETMKPHLDQEISLSNAITGAQYLLQPLRNLEASSKNFVDIAIICNEDHVYQWCFRELCKGRPYPLDLAVDWLRWGTGGWEDSTHFVYVVTDADGAVAAACDIKSSNMERAEIGYWSSANHRGIMTNAVRSVIQLADAAGFKVLFADIHPENRRSMAVIQRCGFTRADRQPTIVGHVPFERIHPNSKNTSADQSVTAQESKAEGTEKPKQESEAHPQ
jgi:RimJ/RimL family protein N-acetyltransferase